MTGGENGSEDTSSIHSEILPNPTTASELIERAILEYRGSKTSETFEKAEALSKEPPSLSQLSQLAAASAAQPHWVGRVSAMEAGPYPGKLGTASNGVTLR